MGRTMVSWLRSSPSTNPYNLTMAHMAVKTVNPQFKSLDDAGPPSFRTSDKTHQERWNRPGIKPCQAAKHWLSPKPGCHGPHWVVGWWVVGFLNAGNHGVHPKYRGCGCCGCCCWVNTMVYFVGKIGNHDVVWCCCLPIFLVKHIGTLVWVNIANDGPVEPQHVYILQGVEPFCLFSISVSH